MSSIRIPLRDFKGIDLSSIGSVGLALDGQKTGSILIADLEFLSKKPVPLRHPDCFWRDQRRLSADADD